MVASILWLLWVAAVWIRDPTIGVALAPPIPGYRVTVTNKALFSRLPVYGDPREDLWPLETATYRYVDRWVRE